MTQPRTLFALAVLGATAGMVGGWFLTLPPPAASGRDEDAQPLSAAARRKPVLAIAACLGLAAVPAAGLLGWKAFQHQRQTRAVAMALTHGDPAQGPFHMQRYGCGGCHTIPGLPGADGKVAPRLDGLRQQVFVGGVARNSGETLVRWIVDPQSLSPRSAMPATGITEAEARDVAAWLYTR